MPGIIKLRLGDMFDGPADLIVLPCSRSGTITPFVGQRLFEYAIPHPNGYTELGGVKFSPFSGAENIAQYVAFAASVAGNSSTLKAIKSIGRSIGEFTRENDSVRNISAPLLGAGAGGLPSEIVVKALSAGFRPNAAEGATLTIHILHRSVFDRLSGRDSETRLTTHAPSKPPRVFISYSGTSDRHTNWVVDLATFLRANGVDARLDRWHLRKGMDLPQWMTNELSLAERVIIISDGRYTERADKRTGGVGWETMLIQGDMLNSAPDSRKYLVIVREEDFLKGRPEYVKTKFCMHWTMASDEHSLRQDLLRELFDVELAPPIGEAPVFYVA